jgi:hypothetical protein
VFCASTLTMKRTFLRVCGRGCKRTKLGLSAKLRGHTASIWFRHSAGSQMQEVTGDLKQTQSFLGHASIGITSDGYVHLQPDSEVESMKKLEETFFQRVVLNRAQNKGRGSKRNGEQGEMLLNCNAHKPQILKGLPAVFG